MKFSKTLAISLSLILTYQVSACTENKKSESEVKALSSDQVEVSARADFEAVKSGKKPIHAVRDPNKPDLTDGGTTFYVGNGYKLTIKSTLTDQNGRHGYLYGPIITFDSILENGKPKELSEVSFYSDEDFKKLVGPE